TIRQFANNTGISEDDLYYGWKHAGTPTVSEIKTIIDQLNLNEDAVLPNEFILTLWHGHKIRIPRIINRNLAYLMGLLAGDGGISKLKLGSYDIKFFNIHETLLENFKSLCEKELDISPKREIVKGVHTLRFY
ncbi:MAG: hypothetical protein QXE30_03835, partial [Candidatus Bathyarchaeia archaeon]